MKRKAFLGAATAALLIGAAAIWGAAERTSADRAAAAPGEPLLTVFLIDGMSERAWAELSAAGRLPTLSRLAERGTLVERGVGAFPSVSGYAYYPFVTGCDAVGSGVLGLRWLARDRAIGAWRNYVGRTNVEMNRDINRSCPTIFEIAAARRSTSFNSYMSRGVGAEIKNGAAYATAKWQHAVGALGALRAVPGIGPAIVPDDFEAEERLVESAIEDLARRPQIQWITLGSPDSSFHVRGDRARYLDLIEHADALIGRYLEAQRALGQDRVVAVVSDHGVAPVEANLDLGKELERALGLKLRRGDAVEFGSSLSEPRAALEEFDGVVAVNGNTQAMIYLRAPNGSWSEPPSASELERYSTPRRARADLIGATAAIEGVEFVFWRTSDASVGVRGEGGAEARIEASARGGETVYRYLPVDEADPLAYGAARAGAWRSEAEWLAETAGARYPAAPALIARLMLAQDAPDLAVTARSGYDFGLDFELIVSNYRGGHGGLRADQIRVPYLIAGPGVPAGSIIPHARARDVGATLAALLGRAPKGARAGAPLFLWPAPRSLAPRP